MIRSLLEKNQRRRALRISQEIAMIEGYADPESPDPARRPLPKRRWRHWVIGTGLLSFLVPLSTPTLEAFVPSDQQERRIENGVHAALGDTSLKVTCLADSKMVVAVHPGPKNGIGLPYTGLIWSAQNRCTAIQEFVQQPVTAADLEHKQLSQNTETKLKGVRHIAHEYAHAVMDATSESTAECYALQLAPNIAAAYGMEPQLKPQLQKRLLEVMTDDQQNDPAWKKYRFDLENCRPGGSADLSSRHMGTQAHFPAA